jgi:hypothetical protein
MLLMKNNKSVKAAITANIKANEYDFTKVLFLMTILHTKYHPNFPNNEINT